MPFLKRVKQLRLRWKIGAVLILLFFVGLIILAKRPHYSLTLQKVEQHGDWLWLEYDLTNLTRHPAEVWEIEDNGSVELALWHSNEQIEYRDRTEFLWEVNSNGFVKPTSRPDSFIAPGETRKAEYRIHTALGDNEFSAFCAVFILPEDSFHRKVRRMISTIERQSFSVGRTLNKCAEILIFPRFEMTDFFVPNELEAQVIRPGLTVQIETFFAQPVPKFLADISADEGLAKLKEFQNADISEFSFDNLEDWLSKIDRLIADQMWQEIDARKASKTSGKPVPENSSGGSEYLKELRRLVKMIPAHLTFDAWNREFQTSRQR